MRSHWPVFLCQCAFMVAVAGLLLLAAGCPSELPPAAKKGAKDDGGLVEKAEDIKALEAAKAVLVKDSDGHVSEVALNRDQGNDADLSHLKGLPYVRDLSANVRQVTDAGLAHLEGHPNLRNLNLEQSAVTNAGM